MIYPFNYRCGKLLNKKLKKRCLSEETATCIITIKGWLRADAADQIKGAPIHRLVEFAQAFNKELKFGLVLISFFYEYVFAYL